MYRGRLIVVFGCGGDRDPGKRPMMGEIAARLADVAIVTDDNPRGEDAGLIRSAILAACPGAREISDRRRAIEEAVGMLAAGDLLLLAGKGHESGQIDEWDRNPAVRRRRNRSRGRRGAGGAASMTHLWSAAEAASATGGRCTRDWNASGISIDTRTLVPGDLFVALIEPAARRTHDFVADALGRGASAAVVSPSAQATLRRTRRC